MTRSTPLNVAPNVDVPAIGAGVTGAGAALDAAARGLGVPLVDAPGMASGAVRTSEEKGEVVDR